MPKLGLVCFVVLLAMSQPLRTVHAAFIESFRPPEELTSDSSDSDVTSANHLPNVWQQLGTITAGGRGAVNAKGFALKIADGNSGTVGGQPADSAAETVLLQKDATSLATLVFYAKKESHRFAMSDCVGTIKLQLSKDGVTWTEVWKPDKKWAPSGYEPVYITLPLTAEDTQFALKWAYTGQECFVTVLDDITFPAVPPEGVTESPPARIDPLHIAAAGKSKSNTSVIMTAATGGAGMNATTTTMPVGVPPPPFPPSFEGMCSWAAQYCGNAPAPKMAPATATNTTTTAAGLVSNKTMAGAGGANSTGLPATANTSRSGNSTAVGSNNTAISIGGQLGTQEEDQLVPATTPPTVAATSDPSDTIQSAPGLTGLATRVGGMLFPNKLPRNAADNAGNGAESGQREDAPGVNAAQGYPRKLRH